MLNIYLTSSLFCPAREADHSPPSSGRGQECVELYLHPQYVVVLSYALGQKRG